MPTGLDHARGLVERLSPEPVCDDRVTERLRLSATNHANTEAHELVGANGFERTLGVCSLCGGTRTVIRRRGLK